MPNAIVVGAGPAGTLLAYVLARRGVLVTLLERQTDFAREFRGEILMPSGIAALREAGLHQQLDALPNLPIGTVELFRGEGRVATVQVAGLPTPPRVVPQPAMLEMIVAEAAKLPGFKLERGVTVRDLIYEKDRVMGVHADTLEGPRDFRGDFVIACDGRASVIRKRAALPQDRIMQGFDVVWGHAPGQFPDARTARGYIGSRHLLIMYPSPEGHTQIGWVIDKGTFGDIKKMGDGWVGKLAPYVSPDLRNFLVANKSGMAHPFLLDVICDRLREWTAPGLLLIGDAAHPMSPVGGQGINVALRDAVVTANHLGRALMMRSDEATLDFAARNIQAERWPEVVTIQDMQQVGPRLLLSNSLLSRVVLSAPLIAFAKMFLSGFLARRLDPFLNGVTRVVMEQ
ncbi:MAG: FAD-dependent monooxygenase [Candidatus Binatus sp.]|jgi:2-polyprenyl-6-methoxyphenol hydroxylase-like FAD-dependent oxidoreductase|uniref:FAD-dependent monooxygenase n=1 Tax=Candidatus Binatus sp. TaxID=2811406 RepID=UPI003C785B9C